MRLLLCFILLLLPVSAAPDYDPLAVPEGQVASVIRDIHDKARDRIIPVRIHLPERKPAPVVMFSHGLGGSRDNNAWLGEHWARRGYFAVFLQHPGSDESVWKGAGIGRRRADLMKAASYENLALRGGDVKAVVDALDGWNREGEWKGRMDMRHIGMSGHSFGAHTSQAAAGQVFPGGRALFREPRITAAMMMSPAPPAAGDAGKAFGGIRIPCLLMTGTRDESPIGRTTPEDRLEVFPALVSAPAWQVVFDKATHMSFGGRAGAEERYHRAILALSTAFWDAQLRRDEDAMRWLDGKGARSVLAPVDRWQRNQAAEARSR